MTEQNQYTVLALVAIVAFVVGQSMGTKAKASTATSTATDQTSDAPAGMDWFVNWSGMK